MEREQNLEEIVDFNSNSNKEHKQVFIKTIIIILGTVSIIFSLDYINNNCYNFISLPIEKI